MIVSLRVANFLSFDKEQELSFVANGKHQNHRAHLVPVPGMGEALVPLLALYGANGAGKSNLVKVLSWLRTVVLTRQRAVRRFLFGGERPTRVELRFLAGSEVFEYAVSLLDDRITGETLSVIKHSGSAKPIFERTTSASGQTTVELGSGLDGKNERLQAMQVIGAKPDETFLRRLFRDLSNDQMTPRLVAVRNWFADLAIVTPEHSYLRLDERIQNESVFRGYLSDLLHSVHSGVEALEVHTRSVARKELPDWMKELFDAVEPGEVIHDGRSGRGGSALTKLDAQTALERLIRSEHKSVNGASGHLEFAEESDGTRRLANLAPMLFDAGQSDAPLVVVVDELDRSLHATLARSFVAEFLRRTQGRQNQLVFTTHETHVLDQDLLRRDEVWFVEKERGGASTLYSLDDFPVRTDLRLDRSYLQGRFGAVPPEIGAAK